MSQRPVEISETYTPGKNVGGTRRVTIDRIPAIEITYAGETDNFLTAEVSERIDVLLTRALRSNSLAYQRVAYTAPDAGLPIDTPSWHEMFEPHPRVVISRRQEATPSNASTVRGR